MTSKEWIKKDDVMDIIKGLPKDLWEEYIYMLKGVWCDEDMQIEALQTEPKHGKWEESPTGWIACSVCGNEPPSETNIATDYCPNCGAKMDGGEAD